MKAKKEPVKDDGVSTISTVAARLNSLLIKERFCVLKIEQKFNRDCHTGIITSNLEYARADNIQVFMTIHESLPSLCDWVKLPETKHNPQ